jgi:hypothetical protein
MEAKYQSLQGPPRFDRLLLVSSALLVCVVGVASFLVADAYHVSPLWPFLAYSSLALILAVGRNKSFRDHWKRPAFIVFFIVWLVVHAAVVTLLLAWVSMVYLLPLICVELFVGFFFAHLLFGGSET